MSEHSEPPVATICCCISFTQYELHMNYIEIFREGTYTQTHSLHAYMCTCIRTISSITYIYIYVYTFIYVCIVIFSLYHLSARQQNVNPGCFHPLSRSEPWSLRAFRLSYWPSGGGDLGSMSRPRRCRRSLANGIKEVNLCWVLTIKKLL